MDKIGHAIGFFVLAVAYGGVVVRNRWPYVFAGLVLFGIAIELAQIPVATRSAEWADLAGDCIGLILGWGALNLWFKNWPVWFERRLGQK